MDRKEVDTIIKEILDTTRKGPDKNRKKKTVKFLKYISGDESPLEAFQLALGRNEKLQYAQYKALTELKLFIEDFDEKISGCIETIGKIMFQCNFVRVLQRILKLNLPQESICKDIPWKIIHYSALIVFKTVIDFSRTLENYSNNIIQSDTVELFMDFIDGGDVLTCFPAMCGLASLCTNSNEARERVIFANGLSKLGYFIYKDNSPKFHLKALKQGLQKYQLDELYRLRDPFPPIEILKGCNPGRRDINYHVLLKFSKKVQLAAAKIILKIAQQNDRHRKMVFEDKVISKAILKWIKTPALLRSEIDMIDLSLLIISTLCMTEAIAEKLIDNHNLIKYLEYGASATVREVFLSYTSVYLQMGITGGYARESLCNNKKILKTLSLFTFTHCKEIQQSVLKTLVLLANSTPEIASKIIESGMKPKQFIILSNFYSEYGDLFKELEQGLKRKATRLWKKEELEFEKTPREFLLTLDADQAVRLKDIGNDKFKNEEYDEAITFYSKALDVCPPSQKDKSGTWKWWITPAALYSNRAQCYLKLEDWLSAYNDCTQAIARCIEENPKAATLLTKTAYRRAKAGLELGYYQSALSDVTLCMRDNSYKNEDIVVLYRQILVNYRKHIGIEPIRRCAICCEGEGEKLKRCANCSEVYCSKQCQLFGWDNGHKAFCS